MRTLRTLAYTFLIALVATGLTACAGHQSASQQVDDAAITTNVQSKLTADPQVNATNMDVDTLDGVVTLRGEVENFAAREEAGRLARRTRGVKAVDNNLRVVTPAEEDDETLGDAWIGTKVKSKLTADPELNPFNIDVDVTDGVVTLSGIVKNDAHRDEAEDLARNTQGVQRVDNQLQIRSK